MALLSPLFEEGLTYTATQLRELIDSLYSTAGIISLGDLIVAQRAAGANMSVDVAAGAAIVIGTDAAFQGKYLCKSTAVTNVTIAAAPSTGNSRIDLIVAEVRDADQNGGTHNDWIIAAVTGTAATTGTQVAPSAPASSYVLAQIAVGPTVTTIVNANVSDLRVFASPRTRRRVVTVTQSATPAINTDKTDVASITGLAQAITSFTTNLTGTPADGDQLLIRITDNGTARALTWGASFEASTAVLPTSTVISAMLIVGFVWNVVTSKWRCVGFS